MYINVIVTLNVLHYLCTLMDIFNSGVSIHFGMNCTLNYLLELLLLIISVCQFALYATDVLLKWCRIIFLTPY